MAERAKITKRPKLKTREPTSTRATIKPREFKTIGDKTIFIPSQDRLATEREKWVKMCGSFRLAPYDFNTLLRWTTGKQMQYLELVALSRNPEFPLKGRCVFTGEIFTLPEAALHWLQRRSAWVVEQSRAYKFTPYLPFYSEWTRREANRVRGIL